MNSHVIRCVIGLYRSLLRDFLYVHPSIEVELRRSNRLDSIVAARGLEFFTLTLPACADFLHRSLASGRLDDDRPPYHGRRSSTDVRPTFLWSFYALIFDDDGLLRPDPSTDAIFALRQLYLFAKKLRLACSKEKIDEAFIELARVDASLPRPHPGTFDDTYPTWARRRGHPLWGSKYHEDGVPGLLPGIPVPTSRKYRRWDKFAELCSRLSVAFGPFDHWRMRPKHGPGAVADPDGIKYELRHWPEKLARVFPPDWFASTDFVDRTVSTREVPCKVLAVPKTQKGPRIIAAEPTAHQWCQGGIQRWLTERIRATFLGRCIDLNDQTPSQRGALLASIDGGLATVDLSAASDRLSCRLVEYVFQANTELLDALHATRSRTAKLPDGQVILLRKFAMMGSACTFPVQSIVFALIAMFSIMEARDDYDMSDSGLEVLASFVRVFGDDIIIPTDAYGALSDILDDVGLKVNPHKSFATGLFRESCGMDAYGGTDVTPAYFLQLYQAQNPESLGSVIEVANNFHKKGLWHSAEWILKTVDEKVLKNLPRGRRDFGPATIFSFVGDAPPSKTRWNGDLHVEEGLFLSIQTKVGVEKGSGEAALMQYMQEEPDPYFPYESGQARRPTHRLVRRWVVLPNQ